MPIVHIQPSGIDIEVEPGESVAEAAWRQDITWPTECYGQMSCTKCYANIVEGEEYVVPADEDELFVLRTRFPAKVRTTFTRLGCCLKVRADGVVLDKLGVMAP